MNSGKKLIYKYVLLSLLGAIGIILMNFIQIPYPIAPFLKIEISDFIVVLVFLVFGVKEALLVALIKTVGNFMMGPVGPFGIGQIIAFLVSLSYVFCMYLSGKIVKSDKGIFKMCKYVFTVAFVTILMTILNYFILTPIYLGELSFVDMKNDALAKLINITGINSYLLSIIVLFVPFNFLKGSLVAIFSYLLGDVFIELYKEKKR